MNGRHDTLHCTARVLAAALLSMALGSPAGGGQRGYAIKGGKILTMAAAGEDPSSIQMIDHGILLIRQGKIEARRLSDHRCLRPLGHARHRRGPHAHRHRRRL
jgi:hypothetical protein